MSEKLFTRGDIPGSNTGDTGVALGTLHVSTLMLDAVATKYLINAAVTGGWKAGGSLAPTAIVSSLLVADNEGKVYNVNGDFTTTADFVEGAGTTYMAGTNIAVINNGTEESPVYKFDVLGGTDQSVVRQINLVNDSLSILPSNSVATIPAALSDAYGVVMLEGAIDSAHGVADGYAATPKAVADALNAAKAYADAQDSTYTLSGDASGETFVITLHGAGHDTAVTSATVPGATSGVYGIVKLADDINGTADAATGFTAATPKAVASALTSATSYTDSKISSSLSGLDFSLSVGAGETLSTLTQEDGQVAAVKQSIAITENQVTNLYAGLKNAISAQVATAQPTTLNGTISLLMGLISALNSAAAVTPTP